MKKLSTLLKNCALAAFLLLSSSLSYAQCGPGQSSLDIAIDLTNDFYPDENGWIIVNTNTGAGVDSACFGVYSLVTGIENITLCLDTGITYSLYAMDDFGDGLDGAEYRLAFTFGSGIDTIGANNFNIARTLCTPAYTNNEIADSTSFYVPYIAPPACLAPDSLTVSAITTTTADLNWRENNSAIEWEIQYDTTGFTLGTGLDSIVNTKPKTINNLTSGTFYDFYVRSICGVGDTSNWSLVSNFRTNCVAINTFPYSENFDTLGTTACWGVEFVSGSAFWALANGNQNASVSARSGSNNAYFYSANYNGDASRLITPPLDLTSLTTPRLNFWYTQVAWGADQDTLGVYYKTSQAGAWTYLTSFSSNTTSWTNVIIALPNASADYYIAFEGYSGYGRGVTLDDIVVEETPNCPEPVSSFTTALTSDSVQLNWAGTGSATEWIIEWDTAGYAAGTSSNSTIVLTDTFVVVNGLDELTTYDFYIRSICGPLDTSSYTTVESFTTPCDPLVAPFTESFDNTSLPSCWATSSTSGGPWVFGTPGFTWNTTGCAGSTPADHTGNSGNYAAMDHSATDVGVILEMPDIDVSALTIPFLEFYFTMCGSGYTPLNLLHIEAFNGTSWDSVSVIQQGTNGWEQFGYDLTGFTYSTDIVRIRFRAESGGSGDDFYGDNAIDDVTIDEAPSCPNPSTLIATSVTANSADLDWTENGTATSWEIEYDSVGFTQGAGNDSLITSKPFAWSGLSSNSTYSYYVRAVCGLGDTSDWIGPLSFTTECPSSFTAPYSEAFDTFAPGCWDQAGDGTPLSGFTGLGASDWRAEEYLNTLANGGGAAINLFSTSDEEWILSPNFDLSVGGPLELLVDAGVTSWLSATADNMGSDDTVQVLISTDAGITWTALETWDVNNQPPTLGQTYTIDLSSYSGTNNMFAIWATDGAVDDPEDYDFHIGSFAIDQKPPCDDATALNSSNLTTDSANLGWTENGSAVQWEISYGSTGFTAGNGTQVVANTNPFDLTGLSSNTAYDWYVRAICGIGDTSNWSDTSSFTTLACSDPTALSSANVSIDSASVSWTENGTATQWEISYGSTGFTAGNGTQVFANTNPFNLLGLNSNTAYDWYVRAICGAGDTSNWSDTSSFTTLNAPLPYYPIATITTEDSTGLADSLNVDCRISGTVTGIDRRAGGYEFALIDLSSGFQEGITVFDFNDLSYYTNPTEGDSLEIYGTVSQLNGLTQFRPDSIVILQTGTATIATAIQVAVLDESTESKLLELSDDFVLLDPSGSFSYNMDATNGIDTITISINSQSDIDDSLNIANNALVPGDTICGMTGIGSQFDSSSPYDDGYQIFPSRYADITICRLAVGLNDVAPAQSTFSIVPNPSSGEFSIRTSGFHNESVRIQIRDISGRMVMDETVINAKNPMNKTIHLNENAKGLYFISIFDGDQVINQKLILK